MKWMMVEGGVVKGGAEAGLKISARDGAVSETVLI
jgi:hypothetical protein